MARTRVLLGMALVGGFLALLAVDALLSGGPLLHVLVAVAMAWGMVEFYVLAERGGARPLKALPAALAVLFVAGDLAVRLSDGRLIEGWLGYDPSDLTRFYTPMGLATVLALLVIAVAHAVGRDPREWLRDAPVTALGLFYVWFLGSHLLAIDAYGTDYLLTFIAAGKLGDAGAWFVGRTWGRHKLAPRISPKKTIEGALGGLAASVATTLVVAGLFGLRGFGFWVLFGLLVGATAQLGDLVESALKRSAGVKDSSALMPQFGGVLDVVDSLILSGPVAFWLLVLR